MGRVFLVILATGAAAHGAESRAMIRGGADVSGQVYTWTVENQHRVPLVGISFAHYRGGAFSVPAGWDTSGTTFLAGTGVPDRPGICVARAPSVTLGIAPYRSGEFRLQLAPVGRDCASGEVTVEFADGTSEVIGGVELPHPETMGDQYITLIGLGTIFVGWLTVRMWRGRRGQAGAESDA